MACSLRLSFLMISILIWAGIYLTGFDTVHWFVFVPAVGTLMVGVTGVCFASMIFKSIGICKD